MELSRCGVLGIVWHYVAVSATSLVSVGKTHVLHTEHSYPGTYTIRGVKHFQLEEFFFGGGRSGVSRQTAWYHGVRIGRNTSFYVHSAFQIIQNRWWRRCMGTLWRSSSPPPCPPVGEGRGRAQCWEGREKKGGSVIEGTLLHWL